jgi:DNA-binding NtrC family response regulator
MSVTILIVDDEEHARSHISAFLNRQAYEVIEAGDLASARQIIQQGRADIILLDIGLPDGNGLMLLEETMHMQVRPPVIVITGHIEVELAVEAMDIGASYFLHKPVRFEKLLERIERAGEIVAMRRELALLRSRQASEVEFVAGSSPAMQAILEKARRAAEKRYSVLIMGETGTGKEVLARYIHSQVPPLNQAADNRRPTKGGGVNGERPYVPINCAAIQPTMLEAELFGYEPGAFTGADKRKAGLMEIADNGILFLDEISQMPTGMQPKLLRALEERAFFRVGGNSQVRVDVQVLAASNRNLEELVERGEFGSDLYFRLNVISLTIPPLRERKADIPELVGLFMRQTNQRRGMNIRDITPRALQALMAYHWPGNIRQLRNTIESAMLFCDEEALDVGHLPAEICR